MADESALDEKNGGSLASGCPAWVDWRETQRCGQPLHCATDGVDSEPVCLMHSKDPAKLDGALFLAVFERFEAIIAAAGTGTANFYGYVFPALSLRKRILLPNCNFRQATFAQEADFRDTTFARTARFEFASFTEDVDFDSTTFSEYADFSSARFTKYLLFTGAKFGQDARFSNATFLGEADFGGIEFTEDAYFNEARFERKTEFGGVTFVRDADFRDAKFRQRVSFESSIFRAAALFSGARFKRLVDFQGATFTLKADFCDAQLRAFSRWEGSRFLSAAEFRKTQFRVDETGKPSAAFILASFAKPDEVVFEGVDLSQVLFHNCDVSRLGFASSVRWGRQPGRSATIFEEIIAGEEAKKSGLLLEDGRKNLSAVAQIYQQLKKNYDSRLDYWTANEFHFGEMEMQRLDVPRSGPLLRVRQWWHRTLSLVALYRWGSSYGNSFRLPLAWIGAVLLLFTVLFPLTGLAHAPVQTIAASPVAAKPVVDTYGSVWRSGGGAVDKMGEEMSLLGHSLLTVVDTATFQRNPEYTPLYPWGRTLAILEALLTSTLAGLFFLALRRQFRR